MLQYSLLMEEMEEIMRSSFKLLLLMVLLIPFSSVLAQDSPPAEATEEPAIYREEGPDAAQVELVEVASGFQRPLFITHAGDGSGRLFVVEQGGKIWILSADGVRLPTPFLDIGGQLSSDVHSGGYTERGLLGLAFHPNFAENGQFFINYTNVSGATIVSRYQVSMDDPNLADPNSEEILMVIQQPFANHNGGHMAFGPDGYLYIAVGDGGSANDPQGHGQNLRTLLGTILRIDVDNTGDGRYGIPEDNPFVTDDMALDEIWAYGLRNPWRFSFDSVTGDMYIADVGQDRYEEVNFQPAGEGGYNYGWNSFEGAHGFAVSTPPSNMVWPIAEYNHDMGCSITGGYVYRGQRLPDLEGVYFYSDWCSGIIWAAYRNLDGEWKNQLFMRSGQQVASFGQDENGELYIVAYNGTILRFEPAQ